MRYKGRASPPRSRVWSRMVILVYFVSSNLSYNYQVLEKRLSFPGSLNKSILLFGFPPKEKKKDLQYLLHMPFIIELWYS